MFGSSAKPMQGKHPGKRSTVDNYMIADGWGIALSHEPCATFESISRGLCKYMYTKGGESICDVAFVFSDLGMIGKSEWMRRDRF